MTSRTMIVRRTAATLLTAGIILTPVSVPAEATHGVRQVVRGHVLVATGTRMAGPLWVGACTFADAVATWAANGRGVFAFRFYVHPATHGRPFRLTPGVPADLDITFYGGGRPKSFERRDLSAERGVVPVSADHAYVCLVAGGPSVSSKGAGTSFVYEAGSRVRR